MGTDIDLSICFCVWNEEKNISLCLDDAYKNIKELIGNNKKFEILVIDNASTDTTPIVVQEYAKKQKDVRLIRHPENYLYAGSYRTAFKEAKGKYIAIIDGDFQHSTKDISKGIKLIGDKSCDVVCGWKKKRNDSIFRKIASLGLRIISRIKLGHKLHDINCGFRIFTNDTAKKIQIQEKINSTGPEIVCECRRLNLKLGEIVVEHFARSDGKGLFDNMGLLFKGSIKFNKYIKRLNKRYGNRPIVQVERL